MRFVLEITKYVFFAFMCAHSLFSGMLFADALSVLLRVRMFYQDIYPKRTNKQTPPPPPKKKPTSKQTNKNPLDNRHLK